MPPLPPRRTILIVAAICAVALAVTAGIVFMITRPSVRVPSLVGTTRAAAEERAADIGLKMTVKGTEFSTTIAEGSVASQEPTAGSVVPAGSGLSVLISAGAGSFAMPDVVGMTLSDARSALRAKGLDVRFVTAPSDGPTGTVTGSEPAAGADVASGDVVRVTIAAAGSTSTLSDLSGTSFVIDPTPPSTGGAPDAAFSVASRLAELLRLSGASVTLTRAASGSAKAPGVEARIAIARESSATVLIGLYVASGGMEGLQVLYMPTARVSPAVAAASGPLADGLYASLRSEYSAVTTLSATAQPVMIGSGLSGAGVSLGSTSAKADRKSFGDPVWVDSIARVISSALSAVYGRSL